MHKVDDGMHACITQSVRLSLTTTLPGPFERSVLDILPAKLLDEACLSHAAVSYHKDLDLSLQRCRVCQSIRLLQAMTCYVDQQNINVMNLLF